MVSAAPAAMVSDEARSTRLRPRRAAIVAASRAEIAPESPVRKITAVSAGGSEKGASSSR